MARDRNGLAILAQLLLSPMLHDRNDSPSAQQTRGLGIWDSSSNKTGWHAPLGDGIRGGPDVSSYAAPSRAANLSGLPSTFVDVGSAETFRDEDVAYANRMWQAGVTKLRASPRWVRGTGGGFKPGRPRGSRSCALTRSR
ncbi:alpha/beta hydrolase fold domain-containing protein [Lentzea aerocolonigenes]|uniref:alpha/beta hydrolase fold domain-containing protein n=1 Tax=Lentzea aerocolonigenes TaxID=68170 RepID=UPI003AF5A3D6